MICRSPPLFAATPPSPSSLTKPTPPPQLIEQVQIDFKFLTPLLGDEDFAASMPHAAQEFEAVTFFWKRKMAELRDCPNMNSAMMESDLTPILEEMLRVCRECVEAVWEFCRNKRHKCARFYLLTNAELLCLFLESRNIYAINPFLSTMYPGIKELVVTGDLITGVQAFNAEELTFRSPIDAIPRPHDNWR